MKFEYVRLPGKRVRCRVASNFFTRLLGMFWNESGLILRPCNQIHTFYGPKIDVYFMNECGDILASYMSVGYGEIVCHADAFQVVEIRC